MTTRATGPLWCSVSGGDVLVSFGAGSRGGIGDVSLPALATHPSIPHPRWIIAGSIAAFGVHVNRDLGLLGHTFSVRFVGSDTITAPGKGYWEFPVQVRPGGSHDHCAVRYR